ncbi:MAG: BF3164 family lipoprotein [Bacteroidales bacterium]|nr:BF3164 family lipoprotein [Bacteroidales bacterium]
MKRLFFFIICFWLTIVSCNNTLKYNISFEGDFVDSEHNETIYLDMLPCFFDSIPLSPLSCCFLDSLFIVGENFNQVTTGFFKVYKNDKLVSQFGEIGNGANDFEIPFLNSKGKLERGFFYISGSKFCKLSIDSVDFKVKQSQLPMPDDFFLVNYVLNYNDSSIVVSQTGDYQLRRYDKNTKSITNYNYYNESGWFSNIPNFNLTMQLFSSSCSSNNKYIVIAYQYLKMIDIISLNDMSLHKRICFQNYDVNDYEVDNKGNISFDNEKVINFFTYVTAGEDRFYALGWDCTTEDASSGKVLSTIYEFDYDGNIIKKYKPNVSITSFAIRGNEIYSIVFDQIQKEKIICKGTLQ